MENCSRRVSRKNTTSSYGVDRCQWNIIPFTEYLRLWLLTKAADWTRKCTRLYLLIQPNAESKPLTLQTNNDLKHPSHDFRQKSAVFCNGRVIHLTCVQCTSLADGKKHPKQELKTAAVGWQNKPSILMTMGFQAVTDCNGFATKRFKY